MSILCIDCGNSRLKWGLRQEGVWTERGAVSLSAAEVPMLAADRLLACNVAGEAGRLAIETLAVHVGVPVEWVRTRAAQCGVTNGYERPEQLGVDRWAALIGARALRTAPTLAVMSGTATTIDVMDADGLFWGGLILPGLALMRGALAANTANLPATAGEYRDLPRKTLDAVASGCIHATVGAIERMFRQIADDPAALCLVSGGAVPALVPHLALPHRVVDNLVLEGLARIAESG